MVSNKEAVLLRQRMNWADDHRKMLVSLEDWQLFNNTLSLWQFQIYCNVYEDFTNYFYQSISEERGRIHLGMELWHG